MKHKAVIFSNITAFLLEKPYGLINKICQISNFFFASMRKKGVKKYDRNSNR